MPTFQDIEFYGIAPTNDNKHKYTALFKINNKYKTVNFGKFNSPDFTSHKCIELKEKHIERYYNKIYDNPLKKGTLTKYILWNLPDLDESIEDYKKSFSL